MSNRRFTIINKASIGYITLMISQKMDREGSTEINNGKMTNVETHKTASMTIA